MLFKTLVVLQVLLTENQEKKMFMFSDVTTATQKRWFFRRFVCATLVPVHVFVSEKNKFVVPSGVFDICKCIRQKRFS